MSDDMKNLTAGTHKRCVMCGQARPLNEYAADKRYNDLVKLRCNSCEAEIAARIAKYGTKAPVKRCRKCLVRKPLAEFARCGGKGGVQPTCRACSPPRNLTKIGSIAGVVADLIRAVAEEHGLTQSESIAKLILDGPTDDAAEAMLIAERDRRLPPPRPAFPSDRLVQL